MKKLLNKKGFTLMEMMIVIAIIVILIAIAVPNFNNSLNSANEATDKANLKAAETAGVVLAQDETKRDATYIYTAEGELKDATSYTVVEADYGKCKTHADEDAYIQVTITAGGEVEADWNTSKDCGE